MLRDLEEAAAAERDASKLALREDGFDADRAADRMAPTREEVPLFVLGVQAVPPSQQPLLAR